MTRTTRKAPASGRPRRSGASARRHRASRTRRIGTLEWALLATAVLLGLVMWWASSGGESSPADGAAFTGSDFHSIVADPARPDTVYVGGHQAVSVSTDAGATWERVDTLDDADAMGWGFTDDTVFVSGHPGLTVARNGLGSFARSNDGLPDTDLHSLGVGGGVVYAAGPRAGVIASTDGGASWQTRTTDAGQAFFGRILVDGSTTLTAADARSGPVRSTDGGRTWTTLDGPASVWLTRSGDSLVASGPQGAHRMEADGIWEPMTIPDGAQLVEADPHDPDRLFAGAHSGTTVEIWISVDGGDTWQPA